MEDGKLAVACVFLALLGTVMLVFLARETEPQKMEIGALGMDDVGRLVEVGGAITGVSERDGNFFLKLCSDKCVQVVVFRSLAQEMKVSSIDLSLLKAGGAVSVSGLVKEYRGELEVVPFDRNSIEVTRSGSAA
jgi:DNA/RNA endonuclease YhcR with UshA esterase domain